MLKTQFYFIYIFIFNYSSIQISLKQNLLSVCTKNKNKIYLAKNLDYIPLINKINKLHLREGKKKKLNKKLK